MADVENRPPDDTVETGLADDLLTPAGAETHDAETHDAGAATTVEPMRPARETDDDDFDPDDTGGRSRLTTGLIIAVIFVVGVFVGVLVGRVLTPAPQPQIVYILDDGGAPSPSSSPSPSNASRPVSSPAPTG